MQVKVPFVYHADAIPPGKRKKSHISLCDETLIELDAAPSSEAPIVAVWEHYDQYADEAMRSELRRHGDRLYKQRFEEYSLDDLAGIDPRRLTGYDITGWYSSEDRELLSDYVKGTKIITPEDCRDLDGDDREVVVENISREAERLLVIDGEVWEQADAPVFVVNLHQSVSREPEITWRASAEAFTTKAELERYLSNERKNYPDSLFVIGAGHLEILEAIRDRVALRYREMLPQLPWTKYLHGLRISSSNGMSPLRLKGSSMR